MKKRTKTNIILAICVILLVLIPFIFVKGEYGGSDDQGTEQIKKFDPSYKAWAHPVWTPPSGRNRKFVVYCARFTGDRNYLLFYWGCSW